jgi:hypothetical protein
LSTEAIVRSVGAFRSDPKLAYLQYRTKPFVDHSNIFSKCILQYTRNLYDHVFRFCTRNGDISPLIGHNVMIRHSALAEQGYWNENRVSEDFELCMKLHIHGYYGKYVYFDDFHHGEGVSLTFEDEILKYSKFAYGASETVFHPIRYWSSNGLFTTTIKQFVRSIHFLRCFSQQFRGPFSKALLHIFLTSTFNGAVL